MLFKKKKELNIFVIIFDFGKNVLMENAEVKKIGVRKIGIAEIGEGDDFIENEREFLEKDKRFHHNLGETATEKNLCGEIVLDDRID